MFQTLFIGSVFAQPEPTAAEIEFQNAWISNISNTSAAEDILIAAMFAQQNQPTAAPELFSIELASPAHNRMRLSIAWYYCRDNKAVPFCSTASITEKLIGLDPNNLEPYLYSMVELLDAGKDDEALAALVKGNSATEANTYYLDKINVVRSRLMNTGYPKDRINWASESVTGALSTYRLYVKLLSICTERSRDNTSWKEQCLAVGKKLETVGNTVVQNVHGFAIQRDALGDSAEENRFKADIVERMAAFNQIRDDANARLDWVLDSALKPGLIYDEINAFGEIEAIKRALSRSE
jgi:hypothetical protein